MFKELMLVPKPIFNKNKEAKGYFLSYQVGNALIEAGKSHLFENSTASPFFDFLNEIGLEALTGNNLIFVPVTNVLLATDIERSCSVDPSLVALLLGGQITLSEANLQRVARFKGLGFKVAFRHYTDYKLLEPFFPYTDYIFTGNETSDIMSALGSIKASGCPIKVIVSNVDSTSDFDRVAAFNAELFRGEFYAETTKINKNNPVSPLKTNYLQMLNQINQDDFDLDKFAKIVQRDTALAVQFLKMVNSSSIRSNKITSLTHAAALLGQKEIKKWGTTAVTSSLAQESPGEIVRLSMLRAKFCENIAGLFEMGVHKDNLFLMGLFSVLDVILDMTMEKALHLVYVPDKVREALMGEENDFSKVFRFIRLYEDGDWTEVSRIALVDKMSISAIAEAYHDALSWYGKLINMSDEDEYLVGEDAP